MAATIGRVRAVFSASTAGLTSGVNTAAASMRKMQSAMASTASSTSALAVMGGAQMFTQMASSAMNAVQSMVRFGLAQGEVVDKTSKLASRLGMTYGELAGLAHAGDLAGVGIDTIGMAATKLDVALVQATNGSATATAKFKKLGLSVQDMAGMNAEQRFQAIAEAISKMPNAADRSAAAMSLFGRAGAQMLPMFEDGAAGLQAMSAEAEKFGLKLTNAQGKDIEGMNDAFTRVQAAINGVVQQIVANLAPAVGDITNAFATMIGETGGASLGKDIAGGILQGARFLASIADWVVKNFSGVFTYFQNIGMKFGAVWDTAGRVIAFLSGVANILKMVWLFAASALGKIAENILFAIKKAGELLFFDMSGMDSSIAAAKAFSSTAFEGSVGAAEDAIKNFEDAFGNAAPSWGEEAAGPLVSMVDKAIARADESSKAIDEASKPPVALIKAEVVIAKSQETKGIESRSAEGIKEMFRIMRGPTAVEDIAQKQLDVQQEIADNTADDGSDIEEFDLAGAAGA